MDIRGLVVEGLWENLDDHLASLEDRQVSEGSDTRVEGQHTCWEHLTLE